MKRALFIFLFAFIGILPFDSCKKSFLEVRTAGELNDYVLANESGIEWLLVGAYSMLPGDKTFYWMWEAASSNWMFGSVRGMEANKGSDSGDQGDIGTIQCFNETPDMSWLNPRWRAIYEGVSRCNNAIRVINIAFSKGIYYPGCGRSVSEAGQGASRMVPF